jgi:hypothetical protein
MKRLPLLKRSQTSKGALSRETRDLAVALEAIRVADLEEARKRGVGLDQGLAPALGRTGAGRDPTAGPALALGPTTGGGAGCRGEEPSTNRPSAKTSTTDHLGEGSTGDLSALTTEEGEVEDSSKTGDASAGDVHFFIFHSNECLESINSNFTIKLDYKSYKSFKIS